MWELRGRCEDFVVQGIGVGVLLLAMPGVFYDPMSLGTRTIEHSV